ncbi:hypothetical protein [Mycoplasma sp. SG1]|uniref:hypothetical protein n=1 Tax=Mycoplasma sp. SG1 TaxID=2810348 RepID=UPI002024155A|nr:hypothetical protein [Mycoplasma sp. SG1]URM52784.1 hypothetical protein JRW51_00355 [Mycoplasma sp. SG1]
MNFLIFILIFLSFFVGWALILFYLLLKKQKKHFNFHFLPALIKIDKLKNEFTTTSNELWIKPNREYVLNNFSDIFSLNAYTIKECVKKYNNIEEVPNLYLTIKTDVKLKDGTLLPCFFKITKLTNEKVEALLIFNNIFNVQQFKSSDAVIKELPERVYNYFNFSNFIYKIYTKQTTNSQIFKKFDYRRYGVIGTIKIENFFRYLFNHDYATEYLNRYIINLIKILYSTLGKDIIIFFSTINEIIIYKPHIKNRLHLKKIDSAFNKRIFTKLNYFNNFFQVKVRSGYYIFKNKNNLNQTVSLDLSFKYAQIALLLGQHNQCDFYTIFDTQNQYLNVFLKTFSFSFLKSKNFLNLNFSPIYKEKRKINNPLGYLIDIFDQPETNFWAINFWNKTAEKFFFNIPAEQTSYLLQVIKYIFSEINKNIIVQKEHLAKSAKSKKKPSLTYFISISFEILFDNLTVISDMLKANNLTNYVCFFINNLFFTNHYKLFKIVEFFKEKNILFSFYANIFNREQLNLILVTKPKYIFIDKFVSKKILSNIYFLNRFRIFINNCYYNSVNLCFESNPGISDSFYKYITHPTSKDLSSEQKHKFKYYFYN